MSFPSNCMLKLMIGLAQVMKGGSPYKGRLQRLQVESASEAQSLQVSFPEGIYERLGSLCDIMKVPGQGFSRLGLIRCPAGLGQEAYEVHFPLTA
jgi:hypothetical protein